jgi:hypothetical protein
MAEGATSEKGVEEEKGSNRRGQPVVWTVDCWGCRKGAFGQTCACTKRTTARTGSLASLGGRRKVCACICMASARGAGLPFGVLGVFMPGDRHPANRKKFSTTTNARFGLATPPKGCSRRHSASMHYPKHANKSSATREMSIGSIPLDVRPSFDGSTAYRHSETANPLCDPKPVQMKKVVRRSESSNSSPCWVYRLH